MAMNPSARERQRRSATRRSWTGSAAKLWLARPHSSNTRCIQSVRLGLFIPPKDREVGPSEIVRVVVTITARAKSRPELP